MDKLDKKIDKFQNQRKVFDSVSVSSSSVQKIEGAVNEWLEKVEEQVNQIESKLDEKVGKQEIGAFLGGIENSLEIGKNAEKMCAKIIDDMVKKWDEQRKQIEGIEIRVNNRMVDSIEELGKIIKNYQKKLKSLE